MLYKMCRIFLTKNLISPIANNSHGSFERINHIGQYFNNETLDKLLSNLFLITVHFAVMSYNECRNNAIMIQLISIISI